MVCLRRSRKTTSIAPKQARMPKSLPTELTCSSSRAFYWFHKVASRHKTLTDLTVFVLFRFMRCFFLWFVKKWAASTVGKQLKGTSFSAAGTNGSLLSLSFGLARTRRECSSASRITTLIRRALVSRCPRRGELALRLFPDVAWWVRTLSWTPLHL